MSAVADTLREARALVERGWTQRRYARSAAKREVLPTSGKAVCWCALGAIGRVVGDPDVGFSTPAVRALRQVVGVPIPWWNDDPERTQADVLAAFDKAIALAEQESAQ